MPIAGDIVANLTANTSQWTSAFSAALDPLNLFAAGVATAAGVAVSSFIETGSQLQDMAERTGISASALSELSFAANQTDTSLESLQTGVVKMQKFLSEARAGSDSAQETLARLGTTVESIGQLTPDRQLEVFADMLAQVSDQGERTTLTQKIFGKGAVDLLPLLANGESGIRSLREEAARLGLTMSDETAASAETLGDALDKAKLAVKATYITVASEFAPALTSAANWTTELIGKNREWISVLLQTVTTVAAVVLVFKAVTLATQAYGKAVAIAQALSGPKGWATLAASLVVVAATAYAVDRAFDGMNAAADEAIDKSQAAADAKAVEAQAGVQVAAAVKQQSSHMQGLASAYRALLPAQTQTLLNVRQMAREWRAAVAAGEPLMLTLQDLQRLQYATILKDSGFTDEFRKVSQELEVLRGEITETDQRFREMLSFGVDAGQVQQLRGLTAERDRLKEQREAAEKAAEDKAREAEQRQQQLLQTRDDVRKSLRFPDDTVRAFADRAKEVQAAIESGALTRAEGLQFLRQEQEKLLASQSDQRDQRQALTDAVSVQSERFNSTLVGLLNRRPGPDPANVTNTLLTNLNSVVAKVEQNTRQFFKLRAL